MAITRKISGDYVAISTDIGKRQAFIPHNLPPSLDLERLMVPLQAATLALGKVRDLAEHMPESSNFISAYIFREVQFSSQIEGTRTSFAELFTDSPKPGDDGTETLNYVRAMHKGVAAIKSGKGLPLCNRLLRNSHKILMAESKRGRSSAPGTFRRQQNHINAAGRVVYFPPPAGKIAAVMGELEKFIHSRSRKMPSLLKVGLAHAQFETIHPFLDGNGRIGRLLIIFMLVSNGILAEPSIAPSLYLKKNKKRYYELLQKVRTNSAWENWLIFFLKAIEESAKELSKDATRLKKLFGEDEIKIEKSASRSRLAPLVFNYFKKRPFLSVNDIVNMSDSIPFASANYACKWLRERKIIDLHNARARNRIFFYPAYFKILSRDGDE